MKITVSGKAQWAKVFEDNRDKEGYQGQWADTSGRCTIDVIVDKDNQERVTNSVCMSKGKPNPDGDGHIFKFTRKFETANDWDGGAPKVYRPDGGEWDFITDGEIGNGSDVLVELDVYQNKNYGTTTTRLERVKVIKAVAFNRDGPQDTGPDPFTANVAEASQAEVVAIPSDEIPF
jgi:hypothetical protein